MNNTNSLHNQSLFNRIYRRIQWDVRVNNSDIAVNVKEGHVTLNGYFDKDYRHAAVVEIIKSTEGVETLDDQTQVVPDYFRSDADLKELIERQIQTLNLTKGEVIRVSVDQGVAKLEGVVFKARHKAFAASDAWGLSGVKDCINLIELKQLPPQPREPRAPMLTPILYSSQLARREMDRFIDNVKQVLARVPFDPMKEHTA